MVFHIYDHLCISMLIYWRVYDIALGTSSAWPGRSSRSFRRLMSQHFAVESWPRWGNTGDF